MKAKLFGIILSIAAVGCLGCEEKYDVYDRNDDRLIFLFPDDQENGAYAKASSYSIDYTFAYNDLDSDTIRLTVKTIGNVTDYARTIKLEQVPFADDSKDDPAVLPDAQPGVHYIAFGNPAYAELHVMPAGLSIARIPVILIRDASLENSRVALRVRIAENDYFKLAYQTRSQIDIFSTSKLAKPENWNFYVDQKYFGTYGIEKHRFMIEVTGEEINAEWLKERFGIDMGDAADPGYAEYMGDWFQEKLVEENARRADMSPPLGPLTEPAEYGAIEVTFITPL